MLFGWCVVDSCFMESTLLTDYQCAEKQQVEKNPSLFTVPLKQPLTTTLVSYEHVVRYLNTKLSRKNFFTFV